MTDAFKTNMPDARRVDLAWVVVGLVILLVAFVRLRTLSMPLERDEGEYAYAGQLLLQGIPPYELAYNMKLPGIYGAYAAVMAVLGQSCEGIHAGLLAVNVACIVLMFLLGRKLFDPVTGAVAAATYGIVSISPALLGLAAHATHFVVLFALAGLLCLRHAMEDGRARFYVGSGCLLGVAFLMKQHGIFFPAFGLLWLAGEEWRGWPVNWRKLAGRVGLFAAGGLLPVGMVGLLLWRAGVLGNFWFWTFVYAKNYVTATSAAAGVRNLEYQFVRLVMAHWPLMLLAVAGFFLLWWRRPMRGKDVLVTAFLGCSAAAVCPGLYFREHYFILLLPALSLLVGLFASLGGRRAMAPGMPGWLPRVAPALAGLALFFAVARQADVFFLRTPEEISRRIYALNPFFESMEIGNYIREHSPANARVMVFGSEPEIYFYSRRHSASGFIYMYDLVKNQPFALEMQRQLISEVESAKPEFLVFVAVPASGLPTVSSQRLMFDWSGNYCADHYTAVGAFDIISPERTDYVWGDEAVNYAFQSRLRVRVFARKAETGRAAVMPGGAVSDAAHTDKEIHAAHDF